NIDSDHARVEMLLELPSRPAAAGEDRRAVTVWAFTADGQRFLEVIDADDREHGPEYLLARDAHLGRDAVEQTRADQEPAAGGSAQATVKDEIGRFVGADVEIVGDTIEVFARDERPHVDRRPAVSWTNLHPSRGVG